MKINVTRKHIRNGLRRSASMCPVALAIHDHTNIYGYVAVTPDEIRIGDDCYYGNYTAYKTSPEVGKFIRTFDNEDNWYRRWWYLRPFSFELTI